MDKVRPQCISCFFVPGPAETKKQMNQNNPNPKPSTTRKDQQIISASSEKWIGSQINYNMPVY